jgi:hypothetical protein
MSEQQANYDTDAQPTRGPWEAITIEKEGTFVDVKGEDSEVAQMSVAGEEGKANAFLIAAAGTAASELPEEYDPVAAVEGLPRLLDALQTIAGADGTRYAGTDALQHVAEKALDAIRTQPEIND